MSNKKRGVFGLDQRAEAEERAAELGVYYKVWEVNRPEKGSLLVVARLADTAMATICKDVDGWTASTKRTVDPASLLAGMTKEQQDAVLERVAQLRASQAVDQEEKEEAKPKRRSRTKKAN